MRISNFLKTLFLFTLSFGLIHFCFSQEKIERESRIRSSEVPEPAKEWLCDSFEELKRVRWFLESSQNGISYEAKFHYNGDYHSVEFNSSGIVEDVEIEIRQSRVPKEVWNEISSYFDAEFNQVKIEKIQIQFSGSISDLEDFFDENEREGILTRYEIVFQGRSSSWGLWEALFDSTGKFISKIKVKIRTNDNLVF